MRGMSPLRVIKRGGKEMGCDAKFKNFLGVKPRRARATVDRRRPRRLSVVQRDIAATSAEGEQEWLGRYIN